MTSRISVLVLLLGSILLASTLPVAAQDETLPTNFVFELVSVGPPWPSQPIGFARLPDGRFLMVQKASGEVRISVPGAPTSPVIHTIPDIESTASRGLAGIAIDPGWPARPYVYFHFSHTSSYIYVTMYTASGDLTDPESTNLSLASPYHLITDVADDSVDHNGGTLRFGPDGMLYASFGEDQDPCAAQDLTDLGGTILRLDVAGLPGEGSGPPPKSAITPAGNPFPGPDENEQLIWAWGLRNPYRFTIDPLTGDLFIADVGRNDYEEVDHIPYAGGAGENFGWPHREGFIDPGLGYQCGIKNAFADPIYVYENGGGLVSIVGAPRYRPSVGSPLSFPVEYHGDVFLLDYFEGWIRRLHETEGEWEVAEEVDGQPSSENWGESFFNYSDLQLGSDGALYLMRLSSAGISSGIYRIARGDPTGVGPRVHATSSPGPRAVPNPALVSSGTSIHWEARRSGPYSLTIYDAPGRVVRTLVGSAPASGPHTIRWDGRSQTGQSAPAGVYFYSLEDERGHREGGKVVLLR